MLAEAEGVVPVDDPHLGHHLGVWRPIPLAWAACEDPPPLTTLLELKAKEPGYFFAERFRESWWEPLRALIGARFEAQATEAGADPASSIFVVKEPGSHAAPFLAELFPASKVIFLLRDGRDVVDSWLDAYQDGSGASEGGAFPVSEEGRVPLVRWLSAVWAYRSRAVRKAFEARADEDRLLVRYEDLCADTVAGLAAICRTLGIDESGLERIVARHRFEAAPGSMRGPGKEIRSASPGSWRNNLSAAERAAMHEEMGDTLEELGYAPEPPVEAVA
jgi:hypothetical protein